MANGNGARPSNPAEINSTKATVKRGSSNTCRPSSAACQAADPSDSGARHSSLCSCSREARTAANSAKASVPATAPVAAALVSSHALRQTSAIPLSAKRSSPARCCGSGATRSRIWRPPAAREMCSSSPAHESAMAAASGVPGPGAPGSANGNTRRAANDPSARPPWRKCPDAFSKVAPFAAARVRSWARRNKNAKSTRQVSTSGSRASTARRRARSLSLAAADGGLSCAAAPLAGSNSSPASKPSHNHRCHQNPLLRIDHPRRLTPASTIAAKSDSRRLGVYSP